MKLNSIIKIMKNNIVLNKIQKNNENYPGLTWKMTKYI